MPDRRQALVGRCRVADPRQPPSPAQFHRFDKALAKLDAATGKAIWSAPLGVARKQRLPIDNPESRWNHYASSAVISDGLAVVGSRNGCVYAFRESDGRQQQRICSSDEITATPVVAGNRVYFGSFDHNVYAADLTSGATLWKTDMKDAVPGDLFRIGDTVLAGSRSYDLTALDAATGKPVWNRYLWFSWVDSSPTMDRDLLAVGSSDGRSALAMDSSTGPPPLSGCRRMVMGPAGDRQADGLRRRGRLGHGLCWQAHRGVAAIDRGSGQLLVVSPVTIGRRLCRALRPGP
jgi:hypothetical protein